MLLIVTPDRNYVNNLLEKIKYRKEEAPKGCEIYKCDYNDHEFITIATGYGKINIGSSLRYACDKYKITVMLCVGTAGSINDCNDIFSAIIPNSTLEFDVDFMPNGFMPGQIPNVNKSLYQTNEDLNDCLVRSCNICGNNYSNDVLASSDMFVTNYGLSNSIRREYNAGAVDCESGCVGQFAYMNDIPYSCIKIISNYANNNGIKQYNLYDDESSVICQRILYKFLKEFYEE